MSAEQRSRLQKILAETAIIHTSEDTPLLGKNGFPQAWLADIRGAFFNPEALDLITDLFWEQFAAQRPLQVTGMEVAAIPLVTAILAKASQRGYTDVNAFIIRKERKEDGRTRIIEGTPTTAPVVLVDDLINSGQSLEKCRVVLQREGLTIAHVFTVLDFHSTAGLRWRAEHNIPLTTLFHLPDFNLSLHSTEPQPATRQTYQPLWRAGVKGANAFYVLPKSGPVLFEDLVCMGTDSGLYMAFDAETGAERWRFDARTKESSPKGIFSTAALHQGKLYFGTYNGNVHCLEAATGKPVYTQQLCEWIGSSPLILPQHNLLIIGLEHAHPRFEGSMAALNLTTGARVWEIATRTYQHGSAAYNPTHDTVIYGTNDCTVAAVKATTGEKVWEVGVRGAVKYAPAVNPSRNLAAATTMEGLICLFNAETGARVHEFETGNQCYCTPLFHGARMFATSADRFLYVINLDTLEIEKKIDCGARLFATPIFAAPGTVIVGTTGGRVLEIDLETLRISGRLTVPDGITNSPALTPNGKLLIVPTYMNELYAFRRFSPNAS